MTAELLIVSAFVIIPLTYNQHLPDFHWKSIGVRAPLKPVTPKPMPKRALRHASSGVFVPRLFVDAQAFGSRGPAVTVLDPETWEPPGLQADGDISGLRSNRVVDVSTHVLTAAPPPPINQPGPAKPPQGPIRVSAGVQSARLVKKVIPE